MLAAADLVGWSKLICFADEPALAHCEIAAFRYRILHMAARMTRAGRVRAPASRSHLGLGQGSLRSASRACVRRSPETPSSVSTPGVDAIRWTPTPPGS